MFILENGTGVDSGDIITWKGEEYEVPSLDEVKEWVFDSVCETPDGERVEPDHPDSWLRILGLI